MLIFCIDEDGFGQYNDLVNPQPLEEQKEPATGDKKENVRAQWGDGGKYS
jgi:hypothetical protein